MSRPLLTATEESRTVKAQDRHRDYLALASRRLIVFDLVILLAIAIGAAVLRWENINWFNARSSETILLYLVPFVWFIALAWSNAWVFSTLASSSDLYVRVLKAGVMTFVSVAGISFLFKANFSREYLLITVVLCTVLLLVSRKISVVRYLRATERVLPRKKGIFLSASPTNKIFDDVQLDFPSSDLSFYFSAIDTDLSVSGLRNFISDEGVDFVVPCSDFLTDSTAVIQLIEMLDHLDCQLYIMDSLGVFATRRGPVAQGARAYSVLSEPRILHSMAVFKRAMDIVIAILVLSFFSPLLIFVACLIKISRRGPVLFVQSRVGVNGRLFRLFKFRTMHQGAVELQEAIWNEAKINGIGNNKMLRDPRVTNVGRFLRKTSIDELPQFLNVLIGSMSVVGPRPVQPVEFEGMSTQVRYRQIAKPGITGLWQVSGRSNTTWEERMQMDYKYVSEWSPYLDLLLILRTVRVVLTGRGAF